MQSIENEDILIIINPNSGNKRTRTIEKKIKSSGYNIPYVITENPDELGKIFEQNIEKYKAFIVAGGDGTVNEALKYLYRRNDKLFGVLPEGSGNGFSRELGFKRSLKSLIEDIKKGESIYVDILTINENICVNMAGLGFDGFVAQIFEKSNNRGLKNYIYAILKSIFLFKPFYATLTIDNKTIQGKFLMITVANTRQFGNNALIAPQASPDDGVFDLVLVRPFPFYLYPVFIVKLFLGTLKDSKYLTYLKLKDRVEIRSDFKIYHVDGEPRSCSDSLSVKMIENKARVIKSAHYRD